MQIGPTTDDSTTSISNIQTGGFESGSPDPVPDPVVIGTDPNTGGGDDPQENIET